MNGRLGNFKKTLAYGQNKTMNMPDSALSLSFAIATASSLSSSMDNEIDYRKGERERSKHAFETAERKERVIEKGGREKCIRKYREYKLNRNVSVREKD